MPDTFMPRVNIGTKAFYEKLRVPGTPQRSEISEILRKIDNDLDDCTTQIFSLQSQLSFLRSQHEQLQNRKMMICSLLSPVHYLPDEILLRIFGFACEENNLNLNHTSPPALAIAAVCYRWRELAVSCSELWSSFEIFCDSFDSPCEYSDLENRLQIFLRRSKEHSLTLNIVPGRDLDPDDPHPLFLELAKHSYRWKHVKFRLEMVSADVLGTLPMLSTLEFESLSREAQCVDLSLISGNGFRKLVTDTCLPPFTSFTESLPVSQVTSLEFMPNVADLFSPLTWFPNLEHLSLDCTLLDTIIPSRAPLTVPITSLELSSVYTELLIAEDHPPIYPFSYSKVYMIEPVMDFLLAPNLSALVVSATPHATYGFAHAITSHTEYSFGRIQTFTERSSCILKNLELRELAIADKCVVNLLKHLHSLTDLRIHDPMQGQDELEYPISKDLISSLHLHRASELNSSAHPIVPHLCSLVLKVRSDDFSASRQSFIDTISSRWIPNGEYAAMLEVSCLRSVELHLSEPVLEEDFELLAPFEKMGMRVVVKGTVD